MDQSTTGVSVVVPTYGEGANVEELVRRVFAALVKIDSDLNRPTQTDREAARFAEKKTAPLPLTSLREVKGRQSRLGSPQTPQTNIEMILVDDDSPDDTAAVVERLANEYPVRILVRKGRRGLSSAVLEGFALAEHDVLVVMDADLQHPPESIPDLLRPVLSGEADMVVGSRYAAGGSLDEHWPTTRRVVSLAATMLARPIVALRDPMSGFFALRREVWQRAKSVRPRGFKIGLELAVRSRCRRLMEVPIRFSPRQAGASKARLGPAVAYAVQLAYLYWFRRKGWMIAAMLALAAAVLILRHHAPEA